MGSPAPCPCACSGSGCPSVPVGALRTRTGQTRLGACYGRDLTCSALLATPFVRAGHSILPVPRHPSQIVPRDFDLGPYFEVIKPGPDRREGMWRVETTGGPAALGT